MTKKISILGLMLVCMTFYNCAVLDGLVGTVPGVGELTQGEIGNGLKQALEFGITEGSNALSAKDGYYKSAYKILLPEEARKVTDRLSKIPGFTNVEEILIEKLNRGAEDAAKKAAPIFKDAITQMTFQDAMNILMGEQNAATTYLEGSTRTKLYNEFQPIILNSLNKVGAVEYWGKAVEKYNKIPFIEDVNPRLDDYVSNEALNGLFSMVAKKEVKIRSNVNERSTDLLRKVFAKQDK